MEYNCESKSTFRRGWFKDLCEGTYSFTYTYCDGKEEYHEVLNAKCKVCRKHIRWKRYKATLEIATILFLLFMLLLLSTPQGAIRRGVFAERGVHTALSGDLKMEKLPRQDEQSKKIEYYDVKIGETSEIWKIIYFHYTCWAEKCSD